MAGGAGPDTRAILERILSGLDVEGRRRALVRLRRRCPGWSDARLCRFLVERSAWRAASLGALSSLPLALPVVGSLLPSLGAGISDMLGVKILQCTLVVDLLLVGKPDASTRELLRGLVAVTARWAGCRDEEDVAVLMERCRGKDGELVRRQLAVKTGSRLSWNLLGGRLRFLPVVGMIAGAWVDHRSLVEFGWVAMGTVLGGEDIECR